MQSIVKGQQFDNITPYSLSQKQASPSFSWLPEWCDQKQWYNQQTVTVSKHIFQMQTPSNTEIWHKRNPTSIKKKRRRPDQAPECGNMQVRISWLECLLIQMIYSLSSFWGAGKQILLLGKACIIPFELSSAERLGSCSFMCTVQSVISLFSSNSLEKRDFPWVWRN